MTKTRMHARQPRSRLPRRNMRILTLRYRVIGLIRTWQAQPCGTYDPICYNNERVIAYTMEAERRVLLPLGIWDLCARWEKEKINYIRGHHNLTFLSSHPIRLCVCDTLACSDGTNKGKVNPTVLGETNLIVSRSKTWKNMRRSEAGCPEDL